MAEPVPSAASFGIRAASSVAVLCLVYGAVLAVGLLTLPSRDAQIQEPWFTLLELLTIAIAPAIVTFTAALHAFASPERKPAALASLAFMSICACVTCVVHFAILTLGHHPAISGQAWAGLIFSFRWPSIAYALDILAWDVFFPLGALFAAAAVQGPGLAQVVRTLLYASAALALVGLAGAPLANMQVRNVGIIGYAVLFPVAAALMVGVFRQNENARAA